VTWRPPKPRYLGRDICSASTSLPYTCLFVLESAFTSIHFLQSPQQSTCWSRWFWYFLPKFQPDPGRCDITRNDDKNLVVYDDSLGPFSDFTSLSSCWPPFCPLFDFQTSDYFDVPYELFGSGHSEPSSGDALCPTPAQDDLQFLPTPNLVDSSIGTGDWFLEARDWASDDLVLPPWAQSDTTVDHFLEFGNNTPDFTLHPPNIDSSSITYESQIYTDFPNSAELYMLPDSELAEAALVSPENPIVLNEREGTAGFPELEPDRALKLATLLGRMCAAGLTAKADSPKSQNSGNFHHYTKDPVKSMETIGPTYKYGRCRA
jgi:hypothetical protein